MNEFIDKLISELENLSSEAEQNMNYCEELSLEDESYTVPAGVSRKKYEKYQEVLNVINKIAEEYNNGWIPVEKELPPQPKENRIFDNRAVELYLVSDGLGDYPFRAFWNGKCFTDGFGKVDVVAWQPLPEDYKQMGE